MMIDETKEKLDKLYTDMAVTCATMTEMSKRLSEQYQSIKILNDSHHNTDIQLTRLDSNHQALSYRLDMVEINLKNTIKNWVTMIGLFITVAGFVINYLL